jgi:uncharacterized metal-binding protein YceD (DUF177 family)
MPRAMPRAVSGMAAPEFSRRIALARLGSERFRREIAATEAERAALARRFDLLAVDRLSAVVELVRQGRDRFLLRAAFEAEFVQSCVVTLDPVSGAVSEQFALLYGPPGAEEEAGLAVEDAVAFEPIVGDAIDIGEAVAQEFALALPAFPRLSGTGVEAVPPPPEDSGPFAALSRLIDRRKC